MNEVVESVARAMAEELDDLDVRGLYIAARAAIVAIRTPTIKMLRRGAAEHTGYYDIGDGDLLREENCEEIFTAMIDEALK